MKTKSGKHSIPRSRKAGSRSRTTRVTVDFPIKEHRKLKALAALEGVTLQEYIRTHIMSKVEAEIPEKKFKKLVEQILDDNEPVLKRLADK